MVLTCRPCSGATLRWNGRPPRGRLVPPPPPRRGGYLSSRGRGPSHWQFGGRGHLRQHTRMVAGRSGDLPRAGIRTGHGGEEPTAAGRTIVGAHDPAPISADHFFAHQSVQTSRNDNVRAARRVAAARRLRRRAEKRQEQMVELRGIGTPTFSMRTRRATNCAIALGRMQATSPNARKSYSRQPPSAGHKPTVGDPSRCLKTGSSSSISSTAAPGRRSRAGNLGLADSRRSIRGRVPSVVVRAMRCRRRRTWASIRAQWRR